MLLERLSTGFGETVSNHCYFTARVCLFLFCCPCKICAATCVPNNNNHNHYSCESGNCRRKISAKFFFNFLSVPCTGENGYTAIVIDVVIDAHFGTFYTTLATAASRQQPAQQNVISLH